MPFCRKCGNQLEEGDRFCSRCGTPVNDQVERGLLVEKIDVGYPEGEHATLVIHAGAGSVEIGSGSEKFVEGTVEFGAPELRPTVTAQGEEVRISQTHDLLSYVPSPRNRWSLKLGSAKPFSLDFGVAAVRSTLSLGGLPITGLQIEAGAGDSRVSFEKANPQAMKSLDVKAGAGELRFTGLLNAGFENMNLRGAVGSIDLEFTGERIVRDARVYVASGVGSVRIRVASGLPTRVRVRGMTGIRASGAFHKSGGGFGDSDYETDAYAMSTGPKLDIDMDVGVGGVSLTTA